MWRDLIRKDCMNIAILAQRPVWINGKYVPKTIKDGSREVYVTTSLWHVVRSRTVKDPDRTLENMIKSFFVFFFCIIYFWWCMWSYSKQGTYGVQCDINMLQYMTTWKGYRPNKRIIKRKNKKTTYGWVIIRSYFQQFNMEKYGPALGTTGGILVFFMRSSKRHLE